MVEDEEAAIRPQLVVGSQEFEDEETTKATAWGATKFEVCTKTGRIRVTDPEDETKKIELSLVFLDPSKWDSDVHDDSVRLGWMAVYETPTQAAMKVQTLFPSFYSPIGIPDDSGVYKVGGAGRLGQWT